MILFDFHVILFFFFLNINSSFQFKKLAFENCASFAKTILPHLSDLTFGKFHWPFLQLCMQNTNTELLQDKEKNSISMHFEKIVPISGIGSSFLHQRTVFYP